MNQKNFEPDCSKCFALCCTALSFERGTQFAHDKPAGSPCQYLQADFKCSIHARREDLGYDGCEAFDCLGAGQRASAIFAAQNWRRDPAIARRLYASFSILLRIQEMRQALQTANNLKIDHSLHAKRLELLEALTGQAESGHEDIVMAAGETLKASKHFMRELARKLA